MHWNLKRASKKAPRLETTSWPGAESVCSKRICYTYYLLGGLRQSCRNCASHTIHSKSLLQMVYIYYIWMNYTFISIYFQDFLCQSYRRKKMGIFTYVPKHWVAADALDRCKNPWCYIPKHEHFPDSLWLTLVYATFCCWQWNCCTYIASTSGFNIHNSQMPHADVLSKFTTLLKCLLIIWGVLTQFPLHSKIIS